MVIFDLPVVEKKERKIATRFRKALLDDGYEMLQYSVYVRLCAKRDDANIHLSRMQQQAPENGSIRMIMLTENQYNDMKIICGEQSAQEKAETTSQLAFFWFINQKIKISINKNTPFNRGIFISIGLYVLYDIQNC